jgi:two-component system cell cycle sensor histidine kinase PleC
MARAHAASACVQSDSIKGLAQSIAKPAYHRLLVAEPALRRAVPTLIIAFLITICLGAFVQVVDQNRQKRGAVKRDLAAVADLLAERLDRIASVRQDRAATIDRLQSLLPGLIPSWGVATGRHVIVTGADQRVLARVPVETTLGDTASTLEAISAALSLTGAAQQGGVTDIVLPNGNGALAVQHIVKSLPGQVIIIQEKVDSLWQSDAALSVTLSATTGFVVLILGFAFHWQSTRAREGDLINDAVRGRIDTALNRGRCGLWDWDLSRGRIFWSQSMFTMLGLDSRNDLLTFGEVNALVKSDDIDLFAIGDQLISGKIDHIDQTFRMQHTGGHWIWLRVRCELSHGAADAGLHLIGIAVDITEQKSLAEDGGGRPAAARRHRDHPGSVRAVGRGRPSGALQLALPAPAQAAGFGCRAGHLL